MLRTYSARAWRAQPRPENQAAIRAGMSPGAQELRIVDVEDGTGGRRPPPA